jgi:hypothetical protein
MNFNIFLIKYFIVKPLPNSFDACPELSTFQMRALKGLSQRNDEYIIDDLEVFYIKNFFIILPGNYH